MLVVFPNFAGFSRFSVCVQQIAFFLLRFSILDHGLCSKLEKYKIYKKMREIVHIQAGQCGNQIGAKVNLESYG